MYLTLHQHIVGPFETWHKCLPILVLFLPRLRYSKCQQCTKPNIIQNLLANASPESGATRPVLVKSITKFASAGLLLWSIACANMATALDLRIVLAEKDSELAAPLQNASLVATLQTKESPKTQDILAAARADYERIVTALYQKGYFAPVVIIQVDGTEVSKISQFANPKTIKNVTIRVDPGRLFRFGRVKIAPLAPETEVPTGFATGQPASLSVLRETVDTSITAWRDIGHAKAALKDQDIAARHQTQTIEANIALNPGPRLQFGKLHVKGTSSVPPERIREIAGLPEGHVFSPEELENASTRLRRTETFNSIAISESDSIGPNNTLDITVQAADALPRRIGFGAEVSSLDGLGFAAFWQHRNLFGGAERLRIGAAVSGIGGQSAGVDYRIEARYDRPATFNEDIDFYIKSEIESLEEETYQSDVFTIESGIRRYVNKNREYSLGLGYRIDKSVDVFGKRNFRVLTLPASALFDYRDEPLDAKTGFYVRAEITPFLGIKGTKDGMLTELDLRGYYTVGAEQKLTLAVRGQLGSLVGPELNNAPPDFLFYSGGGGTVRGQKYQSLAVDLGGGNYVGGRSFLGLSGEARYRINQKFAIVGFYDAGYIGPNSLPERNTGDWHSGAGLGVRYDTGIGPIRFDLAVPVSGPGRNSGFEVYFGIGQSF